jgi:hypothetical protein
MSENPFRSPGERRDDDRLDVLRAQAEVEERLLRERVAEIQKRDREKHRKGLASIPVLVVLTPVVAKASGCGVGGLTPAWGIAWLVVLALALLYARRAWNQV